MSIFDALWAKKTKKAAAEDKLKNIKPVWGSFFTKNLATSDF